MSQRILITGATGFVGGHLAECLLAEPGRAVHGLSRSATWPAEWQHLAGRVRLHAADCGDSPAVEAILQSVAPDWIFHLAGYANAGQSFREPDAAWAGNLGATRALYDALARWGGKARVLYVSSGLIYRQSGDRERGVAEDAVLEPPSPYAASKAATDLLSYQVTRHPGLDVVRARPFNHIGPRQSADYAAANFARQVAAVEAGRQEPLIETGDLSAERDLSDVRDVARAYIALLEHGRSGEAYNVGSGRPVPMQAVLDRLVSMARVRVEVRQKPGSARPADAAVTCCDASKLHRETGWKPRHDLDGTLADTLDYWRQRAEE